MVDRIKMRRDTAANWATYNPVLGDGELGFERDTGRSKLGDGATAWTALAYQGAYDRARANHTGEQPIASVTGLQSALDDKELAANKGVAGGYAGLDGSGKVPSAQLPSYVDDVLEAANFAALPGTGEGGKIYVTVDTGKTWRWSGSAYVEINQPPASTDAVPEGAGNLYFTHQRVRDTVLTGLSTATNAVISAADSVLGALGKLQAQITGHTDDIANPHGVSKDQVGLGSVDNTSDATKNAATATLTNKTVNLSSNTLSGTKAQFNTALSDADFLTTADLVTVAQGGTGVATITGLVKGNGAAAMSAAVAGTDYQAAQSVTGMVKSSGVTRSAAVAGTDYTSPTGAETLSNKTITGSTGAFTTLSASDGISSSLAGGYGVSLSGASTSYRGMLLANTGATTVLGVESSAGGSLASFSPGYATVLATFDANPIIVAVNNSEKGRFTSTGFSANGALSSTGKITSTYANGGGSDTPFSASHATGTGYGWSVTGQAVDGRNWDFVASGNTLALRTVNDANSVAANALRVTRSGNTVSTVATYAAGAVVSTASSTGLAVTGVLSATNGVTAAKASSDVSLKLERTTTFAGSGWLGCNDTHSFLASNGALSAVGQLRITQDALASTAVLSSTGVAVTGALSSTGRHSATSDQTTPTDGSAYFYKSSAGAVVSGSQVVLETGSAGSRSAKVTLDASGNLGLGVTPSAWHSTFRAIDIGAYASVVCESAVTADIFANTYYKPVVGFTYRNNGYASYMRQQGGVFKWYTAPSGTAGNVIPFTQVMVLDANSNLAVTGSVTIGSFTTATRPAHAAGKMIYVSDASAGSKFQGSDGSSWVSLG